MPSLVLVTRITHVERPSSVVVSTVAWMTSAVPPVTVTTATSVAPFGSRHVASTVGMLKLSPSIWIASAASFVIHEPGLMVSTTGGGSSVTSKPPGSKPTLPSGFTTITS